MAILKCRKCRANLTDSKTVFLDCHGQLLKEVTIRPVLDEKCLESSVFLGEENDTIPSWMINQLDMADWIQGKFICPECSARLGSFDFVHKKKCNCGCFVLPSIHITKSKVDYCNKTQNS